MKPLRATPAGRQGFTLVEMIGVLAVVAVLIGILVPRVIQAVRASRLDAVAVGYQSLKSSSMLYFGKYGRFGGVGGTNLDLSGGPFNDWDTAVLLPEGLTEKPFASRLGTGHMVRAVAAVGGPVDGVNAAYSLDGITANSTPMGLILEMVLYEVNLDDARELNRRLDGSRLGEDIATVGRDLKGRVKYDFGGASAGEMHLYLAHK